MDQRYTIDRKNFLNADGSLRIWRWAENRGLSEDNSLQLLGVSLGERGSTMAHSNATGDAAVSNGQLGVDIIRLAAGDGFVPHVHPGDHLLMIVGGAGTITYGGKIYPTDAGQVYLIEGSTPHAVGAVTDHVILAVGSPHKPIDAEDRMVPVEYEAITTEIRELHCLICEKKSVAPQRLHHLGCSHCPCEECNPY